MGAQQERELLGSPVKLPFCGKTVRTRFLKSAMTERLCSYSAEDVKARGKPSKEYIQLYHEWGVGGFGVIVLGNLPIHPEHLEAPGNMVIAPELSFDPVEALKPVVKACKADGALLYGQLTSGGRQTPSHVTKKPISPSGGPAFDAIGMHFEESREMTVDEIKDFVSRFAYAAKVLYDAGADGAQLHAAHGYLLSQFLSPEHNRRDDDYGGDFERRARIVVDIAKAIREKVPDKKFSLAIKINSADFSKGGFDADSCAKMVKKLEELEFDLIELSGGSYENLAFEHKKESTAKREGFFVEFADRIRPNLQKAVLCVTGGFRSRSAMAKAINDKSCDMCGLARPVTQLPRLPAQLVSGELDAASENKVNAQLQTPASVLQLHQLGESRPVSDYGKDADAKEVERQITQQDPPKPIGDYPAM